MRAYLEPQPDDSVPRFDYEAHLDELLARIRRRGRIARGAFRQLRVTIEFRPATR